MDTSSVKYILRPKDVLKTSSLFDMPQETVQYLNDMHLLNTTYIRSLLMRADYERLTNGIHRFGEKERELRYPEVIKAISVEYGVPTQDVVSILHGKNEEVYFCSHCGVRIPKRNIKAKDGLCSNCYVDTITRELLTKG